MQHNTNNEPRVGLGFGDFAFNGLAVPNLAPTLFALTWLGLSLVALGMIGAGIYMLLCVEGWISLLGLIVIGAAPIVLLVGVMIVRILLEAAVMLYRIEVNTRTE